MNKKVAIEIQYKLEGSEKWEVINLSPEEYFELEEGEEPDIDCTPRHNNIIDYIESNVNKVVNIKTVITNTETKTERRFIDTYWNNQKNFIIERIDSSNGFDDVEIIIETKINENPNVYQIIRIVRKDGILIPVLHDFVTENADGTETLTQII